MNPEIKIIIGNSNVGYDSARCVRSDSGKLRILAVEGRKSVMRRVVAQFNRGETVYTTPAGDQLKIRVDNPRW